MSNVNDIKIMELKEQIVVKRDKLNAIKKFSPVTNCSIELDGVRYNIQVLTREQLILLLVKLNSYFYSAKSLELLDDYIISGYKAEEWIVDMKARLDIISRKEEEKKLKEMEIKLDRMLSNEKKTELELSDIAEMLK